MGRGSFVSEGMRQRGQSPVIMAIVLVDRWVVEQWGGSCVGESALDIVKRRHAGGPD